ncbi:MAG: NAD(+) synthase [Chloroflexota bacterium]
MAFLPSRYGYIKIGVVTPELKVADVNFNADKIIDAINEGAGDGAYFLLFPELAVTSYTCGDLFFQHELIVASELAVLRIARATAATRSTVVFGAPLEDSRGKLFNTAVVASCGKILGVVPKTFLANYGEFYEERWFSSDEERTSNTIYIGGEEIPFGADLLFQAENFPGLIVGAEICEDLWAVVPPSFDMAQAGATLLLNLSASNEILGKYEYRTQLVTSTSARAIACYAYASAGIGESSTDTVFSGHSLVAEYGTLLCSTNRYDFNTEIAYALVDVHRLLNERIRNNTFGHGKPRRSYRFIMFEAHESELDSLCRKVENSPFVPLDPGKRAASCREIFSLQTAGLCKRIKHIGIKNVVIGISGGLDSTLALLVAARAFDKLGLDRSGIVAVSMPGLGTTDRTRRNAERLSKLFEATFREIPIGESVLSHLKDIGHPEGKYDVVFENAQARRRTHILMDISNQVNGIVVGTGDLSELALGWCTYNADQMSMYNVNGGVPKTLVRYIVDWSAREEFTGEASEVLLDIAATPISPELLPASEKGELLQETEKTIGPYSLHDFFLYFGFRLQFPPAKILLLAQSAFEGVYDRKEILKWLRVFYRRFFFNQFKRSAMPDGVKIGTVSLSPRTDWRMPSDAEPHLWLEELDKLDAEEAGQSIDK